MSNPIAVILCSSRKPRICPTIADYVISTIKLTSPDSNLQIVDVGKWNLPMFDEPMIPSQIKNTDDYGQPHTRAWSLEVQKYSGFIFILPQYNWGYPAVVKNAIDYLFNEWHGKSAMIVSYGGHGGTKAAAQFSQVLNGVHMNVVETMPSLTFPSRAELVLATQGELDVIGTGMWQIEREIVAKGVGELMACIAQGREGVAG
jgi:NAD(P)H-dependent FMN reductase